ncbi:MAG: hypothetical protein CRU78_18795 [Candidatus Accumulibacter phosphatis]|uniref:Uncharacterized protein n=1 Tax=Candidatus Accumulibacter phosphatis TaxID=327160 RepID=A0A6A7RY63_9PROT|nr:hypothetical protein [Candidatus Accumulibacter phosphatis]
MQANALIIDRDKLQDGARIKLHRGRPELHFAACTGRGRQDIATGNWPVEQGIGRFATVRTMQVNRARQPGDPPDAACRVGRRRRRQQQREEQERQEKRSAQGRR